VQDTYIKEGENHEFSYDEFIEGWRSFDYTFLVVFPQERADEVNALLGPYTDEDWASRHALEVAKEEAQALTASTSSLPGSTWAPARQPARVRGRHLRL
jgi:hypothetical protein